MNTPTRFRYFEAFVYMPLDKKKEALDFPNLDNVALTQIMEESKFINQDDLANVLQAFIIFDRNRSILLDDFYVYLERASYRFQPHWVISMKTNSLVTAAILKRALSKRIHELTKTFHLVTVQVDNQLISDHDRFRIKQRGRFTLENASWFPGEFNKKTITLSQGFTDAETLRLILENPKIQKKLGQYLKDPNTLMHQQIQNQINENQIWDAPV